KLRTTYLLATALYHQCLNATEDSDVERLATKSLSCFQEVLDKEFSTEVAQAAAHLRCILKNYPDAAQTYLKLSQIPGIDFEAMLFEAALLQAKYDKPLALKTFQSIVQAKGMRTSDAAYNSLIL